MRIHVINGPNLHALGRREPERYGKTTLAQLEAGLHALGGQVGAEITTFQSNSEGALVDDIYARIDSGVDGLVINAGAYTHTSIALRDALLATEARFIEVHISNVYAREPFRHHSYLSDIADGIIVGLGTRGYELAVMALIAKLREV